MPSSVKKVQRFTRGGFLGLKKLEGHKDPSRLLSKKTKVGKLRRKDLAGLAKANRFGFRKGIR
tara:strand:- start:190 stop:378 length:189 start_codon:yes stop_codon:yes gene_type:complete